MKANISLNTKGLSIKINKYKMKITPGWILLYAFIFLMVVFTVLPFVYLVSTAFKPLDELFLFPPRFFVMKPTLQNFSDLVLSLSSSSVPFTRYIFNSLLVTIITVLCNVIVCSMGAYGLVKHKPPGANVFFALILMALMYSPHVTRIPSYMVINKLGLINSYWALIIPQVAVAYSFFLMKQFLEQYPNELLESSRIDGANEWTTFWKIVMPSLAPAWSTLIVLCFVYNWNDYISPLIYITSQAKKTMPLAMQTIAGGASTRSIAGGAAAMSIGRAGAVAAATFLMTIPTIIIFTAMQSKVMETMTHSGIKG